MSAAAGFAIALCVASPLLAFLIAACWALWGRGLTERRLTALKAAALSVSFASAVVGTACWLAGGREVQTFRIGKAYLVDTHGLELSFCVDGLSFTMLLLTTVVAGVIGRFSARYLHREPGHLRFAVTLLLAEGSLLLMFAAGNLDLLFAGWELLGTVSSMFVVFYWHRREPVANAFRAFVIYKACDVGFLVAVLLTHHVAGSVSFDVLAAGLPASFTPGWATVIAGLLVVAAMGKSAQFPFSGWLPRAMEGPTPTSSIFYGALSIHAGAFMLMRCEPLLAASHMARGYVTALGFTSAVLGTLSGRVQTEAKGALAYASMVQTSLILMEVGLGWHTLALVHLVGHALVRTLQFLRAPSALHDFHLLDKAAGGDREPTGSHYDAMLPERLRRWLYRLALERGFLDTALDRLVVSPALKLAGRLDRMERGFEAAPPPATPPRATGALDRDRARFRALLFTVAIAVATSSGGSGWLGLDGLGNLLVQQLVWIAVLVVWAMPRQACDSRGLVAVIWLQVASIGLFASEQPLALASWYALATLPLTWSFDPGQGGTGARRWLGASVGLVAVGLLVQPHASLLGLGCVLAGAMIREGVAPFHSWLPRFARSAPLPLVLFAVSTHPGGFLLLRLSGLAPDGAWLLTGACYLAAFTVVYAAVVAMAQDRFRAALAWVALSLSMVTFVGLASGRLEGVVGGLMLWMSKLCSMSGLLLVAAMVEVRVGDRTLLAFGGLAHGAPGLAVAFLALGLASVSIPGTLGFIAEDILHKGLVELSPAVLVAVVFGVALDAVALLRVFGRVFLGPAGGPVHDVDLLARERSPLVVLALLLILGGSWPRDVVHMAVHAVELPGGRSAGCLPTGNRGP